MESVPHVENILKCFHSGGSEAKALFYWLEGHKLKPNITKLPLLGPWARSLTLSAVVVPDQGLPCALSWDLWRKDFCCIIHGFDKKAVFLNEQ